MDDILDLSSIVYRPSSLSANRINFQRCVILAVTLLTFVLFAALLLEDDDLRRPPMIHDRSRDFYTFYRRSTDFRAVTGSHQHVQLNGLAGFGVQRRDANRLAFFHQKLFAACSNNRVCHIFYPQTRPTRHRKVEYYRSPWANEQP